MQVHESLSHEQKKRDGDSLSVSGEARKIIDLLFRRITIIGGSRGAWGARAPPRGFKIHFFLDEYFCWCTCVAKLAYRLMNIAGDERMCGKYLSRASESGRFLET